MLIRLFQQNTLPMLKRCGIRKTDAANFIGVDRGTLYDIPNREEDSVNEAQLLLLWRLIEERLKYGQSQRQLIVQELNEKLEDEDYWFDPNSITPFTDGWCRCFPGIFEDELLDFDAMLSSHRLVFDPEVAYAVFFDEALTPLLRAMKKSARAGRKVILSLRWWIKVAMQTDKEAQRRLGMLEADGVWEHFCSDGQPEGTWQDTFEMLRQIYPGEKLVFLTADPDHAHDALLSNRHEKGTQDEEIIPVRVLGFDAWKCIEPDPSDPELIQHFFSEWTKARIKKIQEYDVRRGIVDPQKMIRKTKETITMNNNQIYSYANTQQAEQEKENKLASLLTPENIQMAIQLGSVGVQLLKKAAPAFSLMAAAAAPAMAAAMPRAKRSMMSVTGAALRVAFKR